MKRLLPIALLGLAMSMTGCAGGWRGDVAPGTATAAPVVKAAPTAGGTASSPEGVTFVWKGEGGAVNLAGEFNGWNTSADPMQKQADGSWTLTKKLEPGRYMYKFVVDGSNWKEDPTAKESADDGFGGKNSVVVVGGPAASAGTPAAPAAPAAPAPQAATGGTSATAEGVTFVWKGEGGSVNLAGEFNGWNTSADPMQKQADGSWTLTKKLEPGRYMYKFVVDGSNWKEDPTAKESADDGFGGKNSVVVVGGPAASAGTPAAPAAPAAPAPQAATGGTSATAEGVTFVWKGEGGAVNLAGEFNGWNTSADPMKKQADGSWTLTKKLEPGRYMYKFVVDGSNWKEDPTAKESADDGFGGKNSVVVVGGPAASAGTPAPAAATTGTPAASGKGRAPVQTADGVVFTFGGAARSVSLAGDFNGWQLTADPLAQQADGSWTITRKLAPGTYEYKFLVDGTTWRTDDANPDTKADPFGGKNSVVTVK